MMEDTIGANLCIDEKSFKEAHTVALDTAFKYFMNNYLGDKEAGKKELIKGIDDLYKRFWSRRLQNIKNNGLKVIVKTDDEMEEIDALVWDLVIQSTLGNKTTQFSVASLIHLRSLVIGNDSFSFVKLFRIEKMESLKSIQIGDNSFTSKKKGRGNDVSKSFIINSCPSLISIEIGCFSFSDYAGKFELNQLPALETIKIGEIGTPSMNFSCASFIVQSHFH